MFCWLLGCPYVLLGQRSSESLGLGPHGKR